MKKIFVVVFIASLAFLTVSSPTYAQLQDSEINLSLKPAIIELVADPGDTISSSLSFTNIGSVPIAGRLKPDSFIPIDTIVDQTKRSQFDASSWITIDKPNLIYIPFTEQNIKFTITVPRDAEAGSHYALITLKPGIVASNRNSTTVLPEISASIFITVSGNIDEKAELVDDFLNISRVYRNNSTKLSFRVRNVGNVHILPSPKLSILKDGKPIRVFSLKPQLILPNTEKTFSVDWGSNVDYGSYTIQAELTYGSAGVPLASAPHQILVLPSLVYVFLLTSTLIIGIVLLTKRHNVPRMITVLRGNANFSGGSFNLDPGHQNLSKPSNPTAPPSEVINALKNQSPILGLDANYSANSINDEKLETTTPVVREKKHIKPKIISTSLNNDASKTTFITQTEASTIVREKPPQPTSAVPTVITITTTTEKMTPKAKLNTTKKSVIVTTSKKSTQIKITGPDPKTKHTAKKKFKATIPTSVKSNPTKSPKVRDITAKSPSKKKPNKKPQAESSTTGDKSKPKNLKK